jgi:hypothetical protein
MKNESVVVYSSEFERMQDEYWMDFFSNHSEWLITIPPILFGILFLSIFFMVFKQIFWKKR